MVRSFHKTLAGVLLLVFPLASLVASVHVHHDLGDPTADCGACPCAVAAIERAPAAAAEGGGGPAGNQDRSHCPVCTLSKSLHATGSPPPVLLPSLAPAGVAPPSRARQAPAASPVRLASRSPPTAPVAA